jgi:hypothetical protein
MVITQGIISDNQCDFRDILHIDTIFYRCCDLIGRVLDANEWENDDN